MSIDGEEGPIDKAARQMREADARYGAAAFGLKHPPDVARVPKRDGLAEAQIAAARDPSAVSDVLDEAVPADCHSTLLIGLEHAAYEEFRLAAAAVHAHENAGAAVMARYRSALAALSSAAIKTR